MKISDSQIRENVNIKIKKKEYPRITANMWSQPTNQPTNQRTNQSTYQPTNQPINVKGTTFLIINYLLTGKKVSLSSPRQARDILLFESLLR